MVKTEWKIFLLFFVLYFIFIHWNGWNENSRFFITKSIVDNGKLNINSFANQTSDRSLFNNNYYSDKDPGISLIAAIPYSLFKTFSESSLNFVDGHTISLYLPTLVNNVPIYDVLNPDRFTLYSLLIVTVFTSVLFAALTVVLLYKITKFFTNNHTERLLITIVGGLASTIFPFALLFTDSGISPFFAFLGFYLLLKKKYENVNQKKYSILSGLSFGLASLTSIQAIIIFFFSIFYVWKLKKSELKFFILGFLIAFSPYLIYNFIIFNNPLSLTKYYLDPNIFGTPNIVHQTVFHKILTILLYFVPSIPITWHLLFDTYKGIFFYYPFLFLSFFGLYIMYKKKNLKFETIFIILIFFFIVSINSSLSEWWGGGYFGPKYLTLLFPFLLIPLIFVLQEKNENIKPLIIVLIIYSIIVNFAGIQHPAPEITGPDLVHIDPQYISKVNSFEFLTNPIFEYYIPGFLNTGPVSRIADTAFNCDGLIDIREPLPIYAQNCSKPILATGEVVIPQNKSIKLCACSQYAGGDGVIFNLSIDDRSDSIFIPSNSCVTQIWQAPFNDNREHNFTVEGGVFGKCSMEGTLVRELNLVDENKSAGTFPLETFDFRNWFEVWNYTGNVRYTTNGTELGVGNCDSSSSIQKAAIIPKDAKTMNIQACADFAGGDGTSLKVNVDKESNMFEIPSNLCQEKNFDISNFADGKEHTITIESGVKGSCNMEAPVVSWVKMFD